MKTAFLIVAVILFALAFCFLIFSVSAVNPLALIALGLTFGFGSQVVS